MIGHFRMDVTERLLDAKVVISFEILWFSLCFLHQNILLDWKNVDFDIIFNRKSVEYLVYSLEKMYFCKEQIE